MIRIGICDDMEFEVCNQERMTNRIIKKLKINAEIYTFTDGEELLEEIETNGYLDILFLDIEMQGKNGIEAAKIIRETDTNMLLIFITAYDKYCRASIEVQPYSFIDKPVAEDKLEEILKKAVALKLKENERFCYISSKRRYSLPLAKIMYFESMGRQICIHCTDGKYLFYGKLGEVEKNLDCCQIKFIRIQISFLVNASYVREWNYDRVFMDDKTQITIGRKYIKEVRHCLMEIMEG